MTHKVTTGTHNDTQSYHKHTQWHTKLPQAHTMTHSYHRHTQWHQVTTSTHKATTSTHNDTELPQAHTTTQKVTTSTHNTQSYNTKAVLTNLHACTDTHTHTQADTCTHTLMHIHRVANTKKEETKPEPYHKWRLNFFASSAVGGNMDLEKICLKLLGMLSKSSIQCPILFISWNHPTKRSVDGKSDWKTTAHCRVLLTIFQRSTEKPELTVEFCCQSSVSQPWPRNSEVNKIKST